ncbi:hypothetical protein [Petrocella sp. FN5]|uniref:hypothetical protein n=1 Tax=Petrocella sp. FN5 TaxID=3032002 RepID=UPI0023DC2778|nr:hypothetical protein [Petrocella sp. FN5]MDF1617830.1 hypothetical protein [Petrocella sp. FN5]
MYINDILEDKTLSIKKRHKILRKLDTKKTGHKYVFIIRLKQDENMLEMVSDREISRLNERNKAFVIVGIGKNREHAFELIEKLMTHLYSRYQIIDNKVMEKELHISWPN